MKKYILGVLSGMVIIPLIESIMEVIYSWIEVTKLLPAKLILKGNEELTELQERQEPTSTSCIGFQYTPTDEEDDDYDE